MDKGYEKERFISLSIKASVAKKFRSYSKYMGASQSRTLLMMIEFFQVNEVSPKDRLGETISSLKYQMKRRFNAVIAIIKTIEKHQTQPTAIMLQKLFEEASKEEGEEDYDFGTPTLITENEELDYYKGAYNRSQKEYQTLKNDVELIIKKTRYVRNNFGMGYYRINISKTEFEHFKQTLNN